MQVEKLRATVAELERQLESAQTLDAESRRVLEQALLDIRSALEDVQPTDAERQSLMTRLNIAVEKFGGSHPTLTGTLMRLLDGLGEMGI